MTPEDARQMCHAPSSAFSAGEWCEAANVLAGQLDEAIATAEGIDRDIRSERTARESAERERDELRKALQDELDNWNPEARPTITAQRESAEAALRSTQAIADELEKALREIEEYTSPVNVTEDESGARFGKFAIVRMQAIARAVLAASPQAGEMPKKVAGRDNP